MFKSSTVTALVMLAIFATMTLMALGFPEKARTMPLMFGIPGTILAAIQVVMEFRKAPVTADAGQAAKARERRAEEFKLFGWLAIFFVGILSFGFIYAAPLLVFAFLRFGQGESWSMSIGGGIGAWLVLWGMFSQFLELYLFEGLLLPVLMG